MTEFFDPREVWAPFWALDGGGARRGEVVHLKAPVAVDQEGRLVGAGDLRARCGRCSRTSRRCWRAWAAAWPTCLR